MERIMKNIKKYRYKLLLLCFVSFAAFAAVVTLNASDLIYRNISNVNQTGITSESSIRAAGAFAMIGVYNQLPTQQSSVKVGQEIKIVWQDGSSERFKVLSFFSPAAGVEPVDGTQQPAPGNSGSGGGPYDDGGGYGPGDGGLGGTPYENCMVDRETGCVAVGESENECHTFSVLNCPP